MNQLGKPLLSKDFGTLQEKIVASLTKLKNRNDALQRNTNLQSDQEINKEIKKQQQAMKKDIEEIKELMKQLSKTAKTPKQKNEVKTITEKSQLEIDRYGRIIKDLVRQSYDSRIDSVRKSIGHSRDDTADYLTHDAKIDVDDENRGPNNKRSMGKGLKSSNSSSRGGKGS